MRRPRPLQIGRLRAVAERPPTARDSRWWWRAYWYDADAGRTLAATLGRCTTAEAERAGAALVARGLPTKAPPAPTRAQTVADLVDCYAAEIDAQLAAGDIERNSHLAYNGALRRLKWASPGHLTTIAVLRLDALDGRHLEEWARCRVIEGRAAPKTAGFDADVLLAAWRWGRRQGLPLAEPPPSLRLPERVPIRPRVTPSPAEVEAAIDALPLRYGVMLRILLVTGARPGEVAALEWADVDLDAATMRLGRHEGNRKTGERVVPLPAADVELLRAWRDRESDGPTTSQPSDEARARWVVGVTPSTSHNALSKRLRRAGIVWTPKGTRRLFSDQLATLTRDPLLVRALAGHTLTVSDRSYRTVPEEVLRGLIEGVSDQREQAKTPTPFAHRGRK